MVGRNENEGEEKGSERKGREGRRGRGKGGKEGEERKGREEEREEGRGGRKKGGKEVDSKCRDSLGYTLTFQHQISLSWWRLSPASIYRMYLYSS